MLNNLNYNKMKIAIKQLDKVYNVLFRVIESDDPTNPTNGTKKVLKVLGKIDELQNEIDNLEIE